MKIDTWEQNDSHIDIDAKGSAKLKVKILA